MQENLKQPTQFHNMKAMSHTRSFVRSFVHSLNEVRFHFKLYCTYKAFSCDCFYSSIFACMVKWWWWSPISLVPLANLMSCMIWMTFNIYHMSARSTQQTLDASFFPPLQLTAYSSCIAHILNWRQQFLSLSVYSHLSFFQSYHSEKFHFSGHIGSGNFKIATSE